MAEIESMNHRRCGTLIGAVADSALGAAIKFTSPDCFPPLSATGKVATRTQRGGVSTQATTHHPGIALDERDNLEASLWAFHDATTHEEAILKPVNLRDNADTTGAVCELLA